jgi:hypothetical protein
MNFKLSLLKLMGAKRQAKKSEVNIFTRWNATQMVILTEYCNCSHWSISLGIDIQTIFIEQNNLIRQAENDKNLCKISTFVIKLNNEVSKELPFGEDRSELISKLLAEHKILTFVFRDAHGVTTLSRKAPDGIFLLKKQFYKLYSFDKLY